MGEFSLKIGRMWGGYSAKFIKGELSLNSIYLFTNFGDNGGINI
jgi:hypothetical protein